MRYRWSTGVLVAAGLALAGCSQNQDMAVEDQPAAAQRVTIEGTNVSLEVPGDWKVSSMEEIKARTADHEKIQQFVAENGDLLSASDLTARLELTAFRATSPVHEGTLQSVDAIRLPVSGTPTEFDAQYMAKEAGSEATGYSLLDHSFGELAMWDMAVPVKAAGEPFEVKITQLAVPITESESLLFTCGSTVKAGNPRELCAAVADSLQRQAA